MTPHRHPHLRRSAYTLIEILVSMAILIVIMYAVIRVVSKVQTLTRDSRTQTEIYESAKIFFDIIGQDLESIVVSNDSGRPIVWTNNTGAMPTDMKMAWVTASGIGASATDTDVIMEVGYHFADSTVARYYTPVSRPEWNPANDLTAAWANNGSWYDNEIAAAHVRSFSIRAYDANNNELTNTPDSVAPAFIRVDISLFDRLAVEIGISESIKSVRKLSRSYCLSSGE
jgi:type II secretory pathway pseudopilin PulG